MMRWLKDYWPVPLAIAALILAAWSVFGCTPTTPVAAPVANLYQVDPGVWRSAQPSTPEAWAYVRRTLGIVYVVKLNFDSEATDDEGAALGMSIDKLPIQPSGDLLSTVEEPDSASVFAAAKAIHDHGAVLVHCTHGQDRTGLVVGVYRVLYDGWSKDRARSEMLSHGYHVELLGLDAWWAGWNGRSP